MSGPVRAELGTRTIFNILGPLTNPAGVKRQLTGAFAAELIRPMAEVLAALGVGARPGWSTAATAPTSCRSPAPTHGGGAGGRRGHASARCTPEDAGLPVHPFEAILGGTPAENAARLPRAAGRGERRLSRRGAAERGRGAVIVAGRGRRRWPRASEIAARAASTAARRGPGGRRRWRRADAGRDDAICDRRRWAPGPTCRSSRDDLARHRRGAGGGDARTVLPAADRSLRRARAGPAGRGARGDPRAGPLPDARQCRRSRLLGPAGTSRCRARCRNIFAEMRGRSRLPPAARRPDATGRAGCPAAEHRLTVPPAPAGGHAKAGLAARWPPRFWRGWPTGRAPSSSGAGTRRRWRARTGPPRTSCLASAHPSPLSARTGFFGSRPFAARQRVAGGTRRGARRLDGSGPIAVRQSSQKTMTVLDHIKAYKLEEIAAAKAHARLPRSRRRRARASPRRGLRRALRSRRSRPATALIAEVKKASPRRA